MPPEETLVPLPARVAPLEKVRSTLLGASVLALKEHGLYERYLGHLAADVKETVLTTPAGVWLPVHVAEEHYRACEGLGLSTSDMLALGNAVAKLTERFYFKIALRAVHEAGGTPWMLLGNADRYWGRYYVGSAVGVDRVGPKEARARVAKNSLAQFAYWRTALRGILTSLAAPFCTTVYSREKAGPTSDAVTYRLSWV